MDRFLNAARQVTRFDARLVLPLAVFLLVYLTLRDGAPWGVSGFVWSAVALCVATAVVRLPSRRRLLEGHDEEVGLGRASWAAIGLIVAVQLAQNDPVFSQRLWTLSLLGLAGGYLVFYLFARDQVARLPIPWRRSREAHGLVLPVEILRLVGFAVLNEAVIAEHDTALWVTSRALMPVLLTPLVRWVTLMILIAREVETRS